MAGRRPVISMIAAMARNRVIGAGGSLPWQLPADMRHFVRTTKGKPVIMGRRNYEDIGGALPGRQNIVLTRDPKYRAPQCTLATTTDEALAAAVETEEIMVIGGQRVYEAFLPICHRLYLTYIDAELDGDTYFPEIDSTLWREVQRVDREPDRDNTHRMTFVVLERL